MTKTRSIIIIITIVMCDKSILHKNCCISQYKLLGMGQKPVSWLLPLSYV